MPHRPLTNAYTILEQHPFRKQSKTHRKMRKFDVPIWYGAVGHPIMPEPPKELRVSPGHYQKTILQCSESTSGTCWNVLRCFTNHHFEESGFRVDISGNRKTIRSSMNMPEVVSDYVYYIISTLTARGWPTTFQIRSKVTFRVDSHFRHLPVNPELIWREIQMIRARKPICTDPRLV